MSTPLSGRSSRIPTPATQSRSGIPSTVSRLPRPGSSILNTLGLSDSVDAQPNVSASGIPSPTLQADGSEEVHAAPHSSMSLSRQDSGASLSQLPPATRPPATPAFVSKLSLEMPSTTRSRTLPNSSSMTMLPRLSPSSASASPRPGTPVNDVPTILSVDQGRSELEPTGIAEAPEISRVYSALDNGSTAGRTRSNILVAVRLRPLSEKERGRGDHALWSVDDAGNVGQYGKDGKFIPKYRYDIVFSPKASNQDVYDTVAKPFVGPALTGFNGTVFAYGVTSSGKTHTMIGTPTDPGIVPRTVTGVFEQAAALTAQQGGNFSVRMSMMEIYNEVLNDLLEPRSINLKVREDGKHGVVVEGLREEPVANAEAALAAIARGDTYRKVSATAFNEDSSRSHTICRLHIESAEGGAAEPSGRKTTAIISLIDLAGSESAKVSLSRGQRMEGSFINKSLLTLGTVIHKLADGHAQHVPFRDSKLTRLLQNSLCGAGAKVAIVCNITPAAAQSEETQNTLKFATRAKLVHISISRNEVLDDAILVRRYQREIAELRRQLALMSSAMPDSSLLSRHSGTGEPGAVAVGIRASVDGGGAASAAASSEETQRLRLWLDEERRLRLQAEQEKSLLEIRLRGLTRLLLNNDNHSGGTKGMSPAGPSLRFGGASNGHHRGFSNDGLPGSASRAESDAYPLDGPATPMFAAHLQAQHAAATAAAAAAALHHSHHARLSPRSPRLSPLSAPGPAQLDGAGEAGGSPAARGPVGDASPIASLQSAGDLHVGSAASLYAGSVDDFDSEIDATDALIRELEDDLQLRADGADVLTFPSGSLSARGPSRLQRQASAAASGGGGGGFGLTPARSMSVRTGGSSIQGDNDKDLEIQVLLADREVLQDQIISVELTNERLVGENESLQREVARLKLEHDKDRRIVRELESDMSELRNFRNETQAELEKLRAENQRTQAALTTPAAGSADVMDSVAAQFAQLRELQGSTGSTDGTGAAVQQRLQQLEEAVSAAVGEAAARSQHLEAAVQNLETQNQWLQGYSLESLPAEERSAVANSIMAAARRAAAAVQQSKLAALQGMGGGGALDTGSIISISSSSVSSTLAGAAVSPPLASSPLAAAMGLDEAL